MLIVASIEFIIRGFIHAEINRYALRVGQQLHFVPDNKNVHDANAVAVKTAGGHHVGHVAREQAKAYRAFAKLADRYKLIQFGTFVDFQKGKYHEELIVKMMLFSSVSNPSNLIKEDVSTISRKRGVIAIFPHDSSFVPSTADLEIRQLWRDLSVTKKHAVKITQRGNLDVDDRQPYPHDSAEMLQQIEIQLREASQKLVNTNEKYLELFKNSGRWSKSERQLRR